MMEQEKLARIRTSRHELALGHYCLMHTWEGDPRWPVILSPYPDAHAQYPWPMRRLDDRYALMPLYVRIDGNNRYWAAWTNFKHKWCNRWRLFQARLIITLVVWGWGECPMNEIPEWKHLRPKKRRRDKTVG